MRIVSWNTNGIRATLNKGFLDSVDQLSPDILAIQETKAMEEQVEGLLPPRWASVWSSAEKKGYSGTSTFLLENPSQWSLQRGLGDELLDAEGRTTLARGPDFSVLNFYIPNGAASPERHLYKMKYLEHLLQWLPKAEKKWGPLVIVGDYNIAHREIDIHDPVRNKDSSGFLPEERQWMDRFFALGFRDCYRELHPQQTEAYTWWSFRQASRERNKGWRIDYISVSDSLFASLKSADIHPHIMGSDHCPVSIELG
jgi:exodeoxyribonuclease III